MLLLIGKRMSNGFRGQKGTSLEGKSYVMVVDNHLMEKRKKIALWRLALNK